MDGGGEEEEGEEGLVWADSSSWIYICPNIGVILEEIIIAIQNFHNNTF